MKVFLLSALLAFSASTRAEDFDPLLAPLAQKYRADLAALEKQRETALRLLRATYLRELTAAETLAASSNDPRASAALKEEREAAQGGGEMRPMFPPQLPTRLRAARKTFVESSAPVLADFAARVKQLNADYLRALASLEGKAGANSLLAKQLAEEKKRVLAPDGTVASSGAAAKRLSSTVLNGDFSQATPEHLPQEWKAAYPTGSAKVVQDASDSFLRVEVKDQPANAGVTQEIKIPEGAKTAVFRGRMRGKPTNAKSLAAAAQLVFWPRDSRGGNLAVTLTPSEHSAAWKTAQSTIELPPSARTVRISARCLFATGSFDFDDISVKFK